MLLKLIKHSFFTSVVLASGLILSKIAVAADKKTEKEEGLLTESQIDAQKKGDVPCGGLQTNDGLYKNQKQGINFKLGPPGVQFGHSNPLGLPPGVQDISITYLWKCGHEINAELIPGPTFGLRYRAGDALYGSYGAGLLLTANGMGPGVYTAIGASFSRSWPLTIEVEFKQGFGISVDDDKPHLITPYAFRVGAGFYWK